MLVHSLSLVTKWSTVSFGVSRMQLVTLFRLLLSHSTHTMSFRVSTAISFRTRCSLKRGVNWNDLTTYQKRGACAIQKLVTKPSKKSGIVTSVVRYSWVIDDEIPIFTQDRDYVESRINFATEGK